MKEKFLPVCRRDMTERGWRELDIIIITGDAYVDHPSYGAAVIGRVLEHAGFKTGIIAQPDWRSTKDFTCLGAPKLFFGITSGNTDSMIANYTANKKPRRSDDYSPSGKTGLRPDRAVITYANRVREAFPDTCIVLGGIEASLRRLAHYDYWDNKVRRSILCDSRADILVYGMGERPVLEIAKRLASFQQSGLTDEKVKLLNGIRGTAVVRKDISALKDYIVIPSFEEISDDKKKFARAFSMMYAQMNPFTAKTVAQQHQTQFVVQFPPALPLSTKELEEIYSLPYTRKWHPVYNTGIKGLETVKFSITSHRGCFGECSFCSLYFHQGKIVQSRSEESILEEARQISRRQDFKGTISDVGGPTANMYAAVCPSWEKAGFCANKKCLVPQKCGRLKLGIAQSLRLYKKIRELPNVKHVFISSGLRYDLLIEEEAKKYLEEICAHHISGLMKVAPEHCCNSVLEVMNKPPLWVYEKFVRAFKETTRKIKKDIFLVNYFISAHPGSSLKEALDMALYLADRKIHPEQIQDFIPSPMTLSSAIYYTGIDPLSGRKIYSSKTFRERKMQRALIQSTNPANRKLVIKALRHLNAMYALKKLVPSFAQERYRKNPRCRRGNN